MPCGATSASTAVESAYERGNLQTCSHACVLARGRLCVSFTPPPWFPPVPASCARSTTAPPPRGTAVASHNSAELRHDAGHARPHASHLPLHHLRVCIKAPDDSASGTAAAVSLGCRDLTLRYCARRGRSTCASHAQLRRLC
uniref:Uncharacterized protein n=1 Tax=Oryza sativa subsp. japonica TaxID=39947 RepID=Q5Z960_ORYSJ|nr:hypothetical protein [Oryza sativa Japonica Group]